jgi:hypothetical protein
VTCICRRTWLCASVLPRGLACALIVGELAGKSLSDLRKVRYFDCCDVGRGEADSGVPEELENDGGNVDGYKPVLEVVLEGDDRMVVLHSGPMVVATSWDVGIDSSFYKRDTRIPCAQSKQEKDRVLGMSLSIHRLVVRDGVVDYARDGT